MCITERLRAGMEFDFSLSRLHHKSFIRINNVPMLIASRDKPDGGNPGVRDVLNRVRRQEDEVLGTSTDTAIANDHSERCCEIELWSTHRPMEETRRGSWVVRSSLLRLCLHALLPGFQVSFFPFVYPPLLFCVSPRNIQAHTFVG